MKTTTADRATVARFMDSTADTAGLILVRCAATLASDTDTADAPDMLRHALTAAAALLNPRGFRGEAVAMAEAAALELASKAPHAWQRAQVAA